MKSSIFTFVLGAGIQVVIYHAHQFNGSVDGLVGERGPAQDVEVELLEVHVVLLTVSHDDGVFEVEEEGELFVSLQTVVPRGSELGFVDGVGVVRLSHVEHTVPSRVVDVARDAARLLWVPG